MRSKDQGKLDRLYEFIKNYQYDNNMSPTTSEMLGVLETTSRDVVNRYVSALEDCGYIKRNGMKSRNIDIIKPISSKDFTAIKVVGNISCGIPNEENENQFSEEILVPKSLFGEGEYYMLKACGDSMIDAGIDDGDMLVISRCSDASNGDIVVALVDGFENTLKRYHNENGVVRLVAENNRYADIFPEALEVQGKLVSCIKFY